MIGAQAAKHAPPPISQRQLVLQRQLPMNRGRVPVEGLPCRDYHIALLDGNTGCTPCPDRPALPRVPRRARASAAISHGLLAPVERKNGWQLAEHLGEAGPQGVQRLLNAADWDADAVRDDLHRLRRRAAGRSGRRADRGRDRLPEEGDEVGRGAAAVQRHGRAAREPADRRLPGLCHRDAGTAFLDRALYLPEAWASDADRRAEAGVPEAVAFATKGELAQRMLARAFAAQVPAAWVVGDTIYGGDELRRWLEGARAARTCSPCPARMDSGRRGDRWKRGHWRTECRTRHGRGCRRGRAARGRAGTIGPAGAAVRRTAGDGAVAARATRA